MFSLQVNKLCPNSKSWDHISHLPHFSQILKDPDPSKPFIVESDTSTIGVRALLSQCFGEKPKFHPVVFYHKNLSTTEHKWTQLNTFQHMMLETRNYWE